MDNLHSERSNEKAFVRFVNLTERTIEIVWINFTGSYVSYQLLEKGRFVDVNTYKKHPWIAIDHHTRDRLHIDKKFVYFPKTTREYLRERRPDREFPMEFERRIPAIVTIPVFSLRHTCLLGVRNMLRRPEDVDFLELPKKIECDLKQVIIQRNKEM